MLPLYVLYTYEANVKPLSLDSITSLSTIGFVYKSDGLYVDSDGNCADMPKYYKKYEKKFARLQKDLSRKKGSKKGETESNNHKKQAVKVAKFSHHVANQRKDFLHKDSAEKINQYDVIRVEDLDMKAMVNKGFRNGKATYDNGWGMYVSMLKYKLEAKGHALVKVDKFF